MEAEMVRKWAPYAETSLLSFLLVLAGIFLYLKTLPLYFRSMDEGEESHLALKKVAIFGVTILLWAMLMRWSNLRRRTSTDTILTIALFTNCLLGLVRLTEYVLQVMGQRHELVRNLGQISLMTLAATTAIALGLCVVLMAGIPARRIRNYFDLNKSL
jgi:membrane-bound metal-dependent hydrolase YbcI (DUF457 family)